MTDRPGTADLVRRACLTECTARKPGNVYPGADFTDLTYAHFVAAAHVAAETLPAAETIGVGPAVLKCVRATRRECGTNVNLGIALLLAPLCAVPEDVSLADGIGPVLSATTVMDAKAVFEAIRLANPGGLGEAPEQDVRDEPTVTLTAAMALAADRDRVAMEYRLGFFGTRRWADYLAQHWPHDRPERWEDRVIGFYLAMLRLFPDSHIARRCGTEEAETVRRHVYASHAGQLRRPVAEQRWVRLLDAWLRADGHRRNPGTTADLTCAALFWAGREQLIELPTEDELAAHAARLVREGGGG